MRRIIVGLVISLLVIPTAALAQTSPTSGSADQTVRILRGSVLLAALPPAVRQQQPRERSWPGRHPVLFGALVGLGTGLAVETAVIPGRSGGEPHSAYIPMFSCVGAGIGSLVGLIVSAARH